MLRLLGIKSSKTHTVVDELLDLQVEHTLNRHVWCVCRKVDAVCRMIMCVLMMPCGVW